MIRVSVMYPNSEGATFDHDYYREKHMELVRRVIPGVKGIQVDKGVSGGGNAPAAYVAIGHLYFDTMDDFAAGMAKGGAEAMADVPNFTNVQPSVLVSETVHL